MAEKNVFQGLRDLFRSNIVIKKNKKGRLVVKDVDMTQTALLSNFVDKYSKVMNNSWGAAHAAAQNQRSAYDVARKELFRDYELMDSDPIISSALDIYSDESTVDNVENEILNIKTEDIKVYEILHHLFYNILNIEFNLWSWIRNMTKYGDFFLKLDIVDQYGIVNVKPLSAYEVTRLEDHDPSDPKRVQFEIDGDARNKQKDQLEDYEVAHFRNLSDTNYLPYGKSMLEGARKVWKQLTLMEDAMLIHRMMRAPEKRIFKVDIGNIPPNQVENFMQQIINKMKKIPVIDQTTGEYNLRYNIESVSEDYYLPVRGGDSGTSIDTLPGLTNDGAIDDIEYLRNKLHAALKVPKAFLGYEEGVGCVVPETKIPLLNGEIKTVKEIIEDYENGIKHYTYAIDSKTNMIVPGEIEWAGYTKKDAELVRVNLDNDKYIDCTPDHRFLTRGGEWVEAQDLEENQSLMPHDTKINNHKVVSVEFLTETKDTCDLTITKYHNFATNAGVIIHNSKATLAAEDVRFARTIEKLQKIIIAELEKVAIVHLKVQGFDDADLINFNLKLTNPSMIHEQEKLELLTQQVDIANNLMENKLISREWVYDNIFEFNQHEKEKIFDGIIEDQKQKFRFEQIETEGNDPAASGEKVGDGNDDDPSGGEHGGSEKDNYRFEIGRERSTAANHKDATSYKRERYGKRDFKHGSPLHPGKGATLVKSENIIDQLKKRFGNTTNSQSILNEDALLKDE